MVSLINLTVKSIIQILKSKFENMACYYNPVENITENSFVISFIQSREIDELFGLVRKIYDFDIHYIQKNTQKFQSGKRMSFTESGTIMEQCCELFKDIEIECSTEDQTKSWVIQPLERNVLRIEREDHLLLKLQMFFTREWDDKEPEAVIELEKIKIKIVGDEK